MMYNVNGKHQRLEGHRKMKRKSIPSECVSSAYFDQPTFWIAQPRGMHTVQ